MCRAVRRPAKTDMFLRSRAPSISHSAGKKAYIDRKKPSAYIKRIVDKSDRAVYDGHSPYI
ncbi:unnamed protein product [Trichogramma brassicae]|uniref:Uncharacterized protein n=1 Tax=Trichogramma brassicae TaxID=86971 RepID=A0A6H5IH74_9HYME|nr:unnamed protein product [Trichogramma brassicae]